MPEMDGISSIKKYQARDPNAKVIMCSAMGQQAMVIESIKAGARTLLLNLFKLIEY